MWLNCIIKCTIIEPLCILQIQEIQLYFTGKKKNTGHMSYANWKIPPIPKLRVIWPSRITTLSVTLGMAIMGMLTFYFRYQRKIKKKELKARSEQSSRRNNLQLPNGGLYWNNIEVYVGCILLIQLFKVYLKYFCWNFRYSWTTCW